MTMISIRLGHFEISVAVDATAPLGRRFWMLAGFPSDPLEPRPYGGSRCLPLAMIDAGGHARWLCAMELDRSFQLFCTHDLFPCDDQAGAEAFSHGILDQHAQQPRLL